MTLVHPPESARLRAQPWPSHRLSFEVQQAWQLLLFTEYGPLHPLSISSLKHLIAKSAKPKERDDRPALFLIQGAYLLVIGALFQPYYQPELFLLQTVSTLLHLGGASILALCSSFLIQGSPIIGASLLLAASFLALGVPSLILSSALLVGVSFPLLSAFLIVLNSSFLLP